MMREQRNITDLLFADITEARLGHVTLTDNSTNTTGSNTTNASVQEQEQHASIATGRTSTAISLLKLLSVREETT